MAETRPVVLPTGQSIDVYPGVFSDEELAGMAGMSLPPSNMSIATPVAPAPPTVAVTAPVGPSMTVPEPPPPAASMMGSGGAPAMPLVSDDAAGGAPVVSTVAGLGGSAPTGPGPMSGAPTVTPGPSGGTPTSVFEPPRAAPGAMSQPRASGGTGRPAPKIRGGMATQPTGMAPWLAQYGEQQGLGGDQEPEPRTPMEKAQRAWDEELAAREKLAMEKRDAAQLQADELERQNRQKEIQAQEAQLYQEEVQRNTKRLADEARRASDEAASRQVNPDQYWSSRPMWARVMAAIGIAAGGALQGSRGGDNPAMSIINDAIERDIASQEMAIQQGWRRADAAQNALATYTAQYGSVPAAREAVRAAMLGQAQGEMMAVQMRAGMNEQQAQATAEVSMLDAQRKEALAQAEQQMLLAQQQASAQALAARRVNPGGLSAKEAETERAKILERIRNRREGLQQLDAASKDYMRFALEPPVSAEGRAEARLPVTMIRGAIWKGLKGRSDAPSGPEAEEIAGVVPDVSSLRGNAMARVGVGGEAGAREGAVTALQTARARIEQQIQEDEAALQSLPTR